MTEDQKRRYLLLKERNTRIIRENNLKKNSLFQECIASLDECEVCSLEESEDIFNKFEAKFPLNTVGRIDWDKFEGTIINENISDMFKIIDLKERYYILWDNAEIPCVICDLRTILEFLDDVLAVSFNTWLLSTDNKMIIEFYHEGIITYGKLIDD